MYAPLSSAADTHANAAYFYLLLHRSGHSPPNSRSSPSAQRTPPHPRRPPPRPPRVRKRRAQAPAPPARRPTPRRPPPPAAPRRPRRRAPRVATSRSQASSPSPRPPLGSRLPKRRSGDTETCSRTSFDPKKTIVRAPRTPPVHSVTRSFFTCVSSVLRFT